MMLLPTQPKHITPLPKSLKIAKSPWVSHRFVHKSTLLLPFVHILVLAQTFQRRVQRYSYMEAWHARMQ